MTRKRFPLYIVVSVVGRLMNVLAVLMAAHSLSLSEFGAYSFLQSSASMAIAISTMNLQVSLNVILSKSVPGRLSLENGVLAFLLPVVALSSCLVALAILFIVAPDMLSSVLNVVGFGGFVAAFAVQSLMQGVLYARGMALLGAVLSGASSLLLGLFIMGLHLASASAVMLAAAVGILATICVGMHFVFKAGIHRNQSAIFAALWRFLSQKGPSLLRFSLLTITSGLLLQTGLWLIQLRLLHIGGPTQNASFALGTQFYNVGIFLPTMFAPLLLRRLSRETNDHIRRKETMLVGAALLPCSFGGYLLFVYFNSSLIGLLPDRYESSSTTINWGVISALVVFTRFPLSAYFQSRLSGWQEALASLCAAAILCGAAFIPGVISSSVSGMQMRTLAQVVLAFSLIAMFAWPKSAAGGLSRKSRS